MRFSPGVRLGPYEIVAPLGAGGMGEVYRATDTRLRREVAIKILGENLVDSPDAARRFEREARAVAALSHPNILSIFEFDIEDKTPFFVTELLQGTTLRRRRSARIPWRKAAEIAACVADGMAAAHARGIIHRDLKPDNIFLTDDGRVKVLDFGVAQIREATVPPVEVSPSESTPAAPSRVALGTIGYAAPEQLTGSPPAASADIFSLGVVLYEIISGRHPFRGRSNAETIAAVLHDDPPPLTHTDSGTPMAIHRIVKRCLEKNPEERFQSARDLAYQLRDVVQESQEAPAPVPSRRPKWLGLAAAAVAIAVIAPGLLYFSNRSKPVAIRAPITSLAILPLANATNDPNLDYLTDGITDTLINELSVLPNIRITARPTAFQYKAKKIDPARIGKELAVAALTTGRVDLRGNNIVVQADLIDTKSGAELWGNTYNRGREDVLMLSSDIARQIATELRLELTEPQKARLSRVPTVSAAAYDLYLRGLHSLNQNTRDGRAQAIKFFQHAVEIDPGYARAWAGLADAYTRYSLHTEPVLMRAKAREAFSHALQLDPELPEAHVSAGLLYLWDDWNLNAAMKEFKRAIELNPNLAAAHESYSRSLCDDAKFDDALREARIAKQLDPLSRGSSINLAATLLYAGQNDAAIAELVRLRTIAPDYPAVHYLLGRVYQVQGRTEEACAEYIKSDELAGVDSTRIAALKQACEDSGLDGYNRERVRFLLTQDRATNAYEIGGLYIELNEKEKGYEYLEKAYEQRNMGMLLLKSDPGFNALRHEPRFRKLMARVGFDLKAAGLDETFPAQHQ